MECAVPLQSKTINNAKIWHIYMNIITMIAAPTSTITTTRPMSLTNIIMTTKVTNIIITSTP